MARIRTIKPEFFTSEQIVECSPTARLLFVGLWCFCDDYGIHPASAKRLKMEVFPGDAITDSDVQTMVDELLAAKLLATFQHEGQGFWFVTGWKKHQKIDKPSHKYPEPPGQEFDAGSPNGCRTVVDDSTNGRDGAERSGTGAEGNGGERKGSAGTGARRKIAKPQTIKSRDLTPDHLRDTPSVLSWLAGAAKRLKLDSESHDIRVHVLACAEAAIAGGDNPPALFQSKVSKGAAGEWSYPDECHEAAKRRLRDVRPVTMPAVASAADRLKADIPATVEGGSDEF